MSPPYSFSRRQFLCDSVYSAVALATIGNSANAATAAAEISAVAEIHVSAANGDDSAAGSAAHPLK
ncbi:MAG TPA: hypothetical protein VF573_15265, partial [Paraburkholderia sp.]|uniref:hypothetical protein n=1 Tax=Paraburkholderia sp. TaxID=1926495 RepID=UPI002ED3C69C